MFPQEECYRKKMSEIQKKVKNNFKSKETASKTMHNIWDDKDKKNVMIEKIKNGMNGEKYKKNAGDARRKLWKNEDYRKKMTEERIIRWKNKEFIHKMEKIHHERILNGILNNFNAFKFKDYKMPSGKIVRIQGYENMTLDILLKEKKEKNIFVGIQEVEEQVGKIIFEKNGKKHRYFPDAFLKVENEIIETKSIWTYIKFIENNYLKKDACLRMGFNFKFVIFGKKGSNTLKNNEVELKKKSNKVMELDNFLCFIINFEVNEAKN